MLRPTLITVPAALTLVTLVDAKAHLRVDFSDDDTLITGLISAAESLLDGYAGIVGRALLNQTWQQQFSSFSDRLDLQVPIASSIATVTYFDRVNTTQTLASSVYQMLSDELGSFVTLKADQAWPTTYSRVDAVTVQWVAGYGAGSAAVPGAIITAIKLLVSHWYENRGPVTMDTKSQEMPLSVKALLAPFRRVKI